MDYAKFYYDFIVGETPTIENYNRTKTFFEYLEDANLKTSMILDLILNEFDNKDFLSLEDIPDSIWDNSLLNKNCFYHHKELQIMSPPPTWDKNFPFYLEMKIIYNEKDLLNYFIERTNFRKEWVDIEKDVGSIKYLLNKYKKFSFVEPVDFLLNLIDYSISKEDEIKNIYDICKYDIEFATLFEKDIKNCSMEHKNKIIWRTDLCGI